MTAGGLTPPKTRSLVGCSGELQTHAPSTYKIPTCRDWPPDFRVTLLASGHNREDSIYRSKAVGEPPLMLAISVFHAIKDAIASVGEARLSPRLHAPATPEAILMAVEDLRARQQAMPAPSAAAGSRPV